MERERRRAARARVGHHTRELTMRWKRCADFGTHTLRTAQNGLHWSVSRMAFAPPRNERNATPSRIHRVLTWEDSLANLPIRPFYLPYQEHFHRLRQPVSMHGIQAPSVLEWPSRNGGVCRNMWFCSSWPAPLAIGTTHRPVSAALARGSSPRGTTRWLALLTPKVGSSSLMHFAHTLSGFIQNDSEVQTAYTWQHKAVLATSSCSNASYTNIIEEMVETAASGAVRPGILLSGCGHAATFDLGAENARRRDAFDDHTFAFALVRDPISRFISALNPHGRYVSLCEPCMLNIDLRNRYMCRHNKEKCALPFPCLCSCCVTVLQTPNHPSNTSPLSILAFVM